MLRQVAAYFVVITCWLPNARAQTLAAQQALDSVRSKYRLPAIVAAIIEPERVRYVYAGVRRSDQPDAVQLTDYFHIGSDTKGITSLLAAKLVEQGNLRWSSKLVEVVPALRGKILPAYADVTLDQLLAHRAGIRPYQAGSDYQSLPAFTGTISARRLQFAQAVLQQAPVVPTSGRATAYSNAGYVLAALMLEHASHHSWEELVARAFHTLKLHYMLGFPSQTDPSQPWGHWLQPADSTCTPLGPTHSYKLRDYMAPAGDIAMPLPDFARLVQLHLRGLLGKGGYVSAATYQTIHFGKPEYAYGWGVEKQAITGDLISFHDGSAGTFYCHAILFTSQKVAFVVMANQGGAAAQQACNELRSRLQSLHLRGAL